MRLFSHTFLTNLIVVIFGLSVSTPLIGQTLQIDSLKANYLEGFIDFIYRDGFELPEQTLIGIVGDNDLASHLETLAQSKNRTRTIVVQKIELKDFNKHRSCYFDLVFIGSGQKKRWVEIFDKMENCRALIVGEESGFLKAGGAMEFAVIKNRLRFRLELQHINQRGLKLSSKLTELAIE